MTEYELAVEKNVLATRKFLKVREMYRKNSIGFGEFIAGWEEYKIAEAEFDEAFAEEFPH